MWCISVVCVCVCVFGRGVVQPVSGLLTSPFHLFSQVVIKSDKAGFSIFALFYFVMFSSSPLGIGFVVSRVVASLEWNGSGWWQTGVVKPLKMMDEIGPFFFSFSCFMQSSGTGHGRNSGSSLGDDGLKPEFCLRFWTKKVVHFDVIPAQESLSADFQNVWLIGRAMKRNVMKLGFCFIMHCFGYGDFNREVQEILHSASTTICSYLGLRLSTRLRDCFQVWMRDNYR
jgi:hypothetical protein